MNSMMEGMKTLNDFYIMDIDMYSISCENSEKERKNVLQSFTNNNEKIQLLFNIRILNECIDIPACDSIYISYAPKNKITTIQRISRAIRTDENNPYKIANVYIWCEAYEEILETLSSIKEYDIMFNSNAVWWYEYKYGDSPPNHSCHFVYIKHVHACICISMCGCVILRIFHSNSIICTDVIRLV